MGIGPQLLLSRVKASGVEERSRICIALVFIATLSVVWTKPNLKTTARVMNRVLWVGFCGEAESRTNLHFALQLMLWKWNRGAEMNLAAFLPDTRCAPYHPGT